MLQHPLRYPGGKSILANYVENLIEYNDLTNCALYEPYAGSAAISMEMLDRNKVSNAILIERDPLLFAFWKSVFEKTDELCDKIENTEISINTWNELSYLRNYDTVFGHSLVELGFACLFFNRTNYSGILKAGPIGGKLQESKYKIDCRFNKKKVIDSIIHLSKYKGAVKVVFSDAIEFMKHNIKTLTETNCLVYIDPPYYSKGKLLYRYFYNDNDHVRLAKFLKGSHFPWLLSYDDHPFINALYSANDKTLSQQKIYIDYSIKKCKKGTEVLISNLVIPPTMSNSKLVNSLPSSLGGI